MPVGKKTKKISTGKKIAKSTTLKKTNVKNCEVCDAGSLDFPMMFVFSGLVIVAAIYLVEFVI